MKKQQKGVTLIALVLTIIVLIILATVTITKLVGNDGILYKASEAARESEMASIKEALEVMAIKDLINDVTNDESGDAIELFLSEGVIDEDYVVNVNKLLGTKMDKAIYKIEGDKLVYVNASGEKEKEKELQIMVNKKSFITEWNFEAGDVIVLPIATGYTGNNNFVINWGDGSPEETINDKEVALTEKPTHTYTDSGIYKISITGICTYFTFYQSDLPTTQNSKLINILNWGETESRCLNFANATNLEKIPKPSKKTFEYYKEDGFSSMFSHCEKLKEIPSGFLDYIPENITTFKSMFYDCISLSSIPNNLFDKATNVTSFEETFYKCTGLTSIPENLFAQATNVTTFEQTFYNCTNLTSIPENLFAQATDVTTFEQTFYKCTNLASIPEHLFDQAVNVTNFSKTFYKCNKIASIPENLFEKNQKVVNFIGTFYDLQLIETAPKLWERTTEGLDGTGCFGSCDTLKSNGFEDSIPSPWANSL